MGTYHIETFGCQMTEHDSEGIAGILSRLGMSRVRSADQADVVVLNTCSVRDKPHRKAFARLDDFRLLKQERPELLVIVAGCMAQLIPDEIQARAPHVDLLVGPGSYVQLEDTVRRRLNERGPTQVLLDRCAPDAGSMPFEREELHRAWVNVMFGCDNYCAYCVVPYARGPEVSRRPEAILDEVRGLAEGGVVEVTLLGQNVNSYGRGLEPAIDFADLLERVNAVEGIQRIRFTTSHPKDLSPKLIDAMARLDNVCEHLHLPVQAGADSVLARMGRGHRADEYRRVVLSARTAMPDLSLTTDVMVGFPGETEEDFEQTRALFEEVRYDQAFMFKYNDRPGTRAAELPGKAPEAEKQRRLEALVKLQNRVAREINEAEVGREFEVLVDGPDRKTPGRMRGRTRQNKLMIFEGGPDLVCGFVTVKAAEPRLWGWIGELMAVEGD